VVVVVGDVLAQGGEEVPLAVDECPVQTLTASGASQRSAYAFALGACGGVRTIRMPSAVKTASNVAVNFASRS